MTNRKTIFTIEERYSKILNRIFYGVDCKNGCFCEFHTIKEAEDKVKELYKRLLKGEEFPLINCATDIDVGTKTTKEEND